MLVLLVCGGEVIELHILYLSHSDFPVAGSSSNFQHIYCSVVYLGRSCTHPVEESLQQHLCLQQDWRSHCNACFARWLMYDNVL